MSAKQSTGLKEASLMIKREHVETEVTIIQTKMFLEEAKRSWGLQAKLPTISRAARYHLLQPGDGADKGERLQIGEVIVEKVQGEWTPARLTG